MAKEDHSVHLKKEPIWRSCRVILAAVGFFGTFMLYAQRMNISVAILCMTNHTAVANQDAALKALTNVTENFTKYDVSENTSSTQKSCQLKNVNKQYDDGEFVWNSETRGIILGVFFWGYLVTQIPAGILVQKLGAKGIILGLSILTALSTILIPIAARTSFAFLIILRVVSGIGSGVWFPCFHYLWSRWAPPMERAKLVGFTYAGLHIGNAVTLPIAGLLCQYGFSGGWPSIFYLFGAAALAWCILWGFLVFDGPESHPRISKYEKQYIQSSLKGQIEEKNTNLKIPILSILKSPAVWAIIIVNVTFDWNGYLFLTSVPSYMKDVLKFDISENGGLSSLPYIGFWIGQVAMAYISDALREANVLSTTWIRKTMTSIGMFGPGILVMILGYLNCENKYVAVALLTLALTLKGGVFSGCFINHVDIAPRYAGILFALSNTIASLTGFFAPMMVGAITKQNLPSQWRVVFFISAAIYAFGGIIYVIFASGDLQSWAATDPEIEVSQPVSRENSRTELEPLKTALVNGHSDGIDPNGAHLA